MRDLHESATYNAALSKNSRQQSVPELRHSSSSAADTYCTSTISRKTLQLPLDKCNARFLKESAQSFLQIHDEADMKQEELRRLELNIEIVESYCEQVCGSKPRNRDQLERVEKQITTTGQSIASFWSKIKRPPLSPTSETSPMTEPNQDIIIAFCKTLQSYNNLLGNYCNSLESNGLLSYHKWSDSIDQQTEITPHEQAEELMSLSQSREYQVKFCHANFSQKRTALRSASHTSFGTRTYSVSEGLDERDGLICLCCKSFLLFLSNHKRLIIPISIALFLLLVIIVITIVVTRS